MSRVRSFVQACHSGADNSAAHSDDVLAHAGASAQAGAASDRIRMRLAQGNGDMSTSAIASAVRAEYPGIGMSGVVQEVRRIRGEIHGAGPVEPLLDLPDVTDVLVNGASEVWVDGPAGLCRVDSLFRDDDHVRATAVRLAAACGRRLDDASPYADGFYQRYAAGGSVRVHAVLPPVVEHPCLSLRVLGTASTSLDDLVRSGSVPPDMADELRSLVRSRQAFVVSGGTGAGKTTLLSALLAEVSPDERIVCVEDTRELHPRHPHVVALTTTSPNVEGQGEITLRDVVKQTLRMRPDRIVVGEIRGAEIQELFAALNTGHDGGCGTIHANGPEEIPARCEALGAMAGMSPESVRTQFRAAIRVVVHVERTSSRRLASVGVVPPVGKNSSFFDGNRNDEQPLYPGVSSSPGVVMVWTADGGRTDAWPLWERIVRGGAR